MKIIFNPVDKLIINPWRIRFFLQKIMINPQSEYDLLRTWLIITWYPQPHVQVHVLKVLLNTIKECAAYSVRIKGKFVKILKWFKECVYSIALHVHSAESWDEWIKYMYCTCTYTCTCI